MTGGFNGSSSKPMPWIYIAYIQYINAEERRVFYVAITRARHKNYLVHNLTNPSKFVTELMKTFGLQAQSSLRCPECQGFLVKRSGPFSAFYGCSNYPQCEGWLLITAN